MKLRTLLVLTRVAFVWTSNNNKSFTSLDPSGLADMLTELCRGANTCNEYRTSEAPQKTFSPGFESCCFDCSCGPTCEVDGNCCFPNITSSQEKLDDKTLEPETSCLFPSTVPPEVKTLVRYYKMISNIPKRIEDGIYSVTNLSCGEEKVAPWGSLYPVYSAERRRIYKNLACAKADNVNDGELWDARLHCLNTLDGDIIVDVTSFVNGLNSGFVHKRCRIDFIYKGDYQDIRSLICFVDLLDSCEAENFEIPDVVNASHEEIKEACKSGLVSPYTQTDELFANVFCFICTGGDIISESCLKINDELSRIGSLHGFISLIDNSFISDTLRYYNKNSKQSPQACTVPSVWNSVQALDCRRVFCPSGQLRDSNDRCKYPSTVWLGQDYIVPIDLTTEESIDVYQVFQVQPGNVTSILPNFTHPWQNNWSIHSISYEDTGENRNKTSLRIILTKRITNVRPHRLFNNIKNRINRNWMLTHNNITTILTSRITKYKSLSQVGDSLMAIGNLSEIISQPIFLKIYSKFGLQTNKFVISKLFWCEQVELTQHDFVLSFDMRVLFNRITMRFLYNGEFVLVNVNSDHDFSARICIEDSGMYLTDRLAVSNGNMSYVTYSVLLLNLIILLF